MLRDYLGNDVATHQIETPLSARTHQASQPHQAVQPNIIALPQASSNLGSTETMSPPPLAPQIVDIIPQSGPHFRNQRIWLKVQNLPRGNGLRYLVGFGEAGIVSTSFVCSEEDKVQILECSTPITPTPCFTVPSLMQFSDPHTPLGSSDVSYEFASQAS